MDDSGRSKNLKASDLWSSDDDSDNDADKIDDTTLPEEDWISGNLDVMEEDSTDIIEEEEEITFVKLGKRRHLQVNGKKKLNLTAKSDEDHEPIVAVCQKGSNAETKKPKREVLAIEKNKKVRRYSEPQKILNNEELLQKRADRFGTPEKRKSEKSATPDLNILKRRSERFGTPDLNTLKRRSERFTTPDLNTLKRRSERFGTPDLDILKRRSERFGVEEVETSEIIKKRQKRFGIVDCMELKAEYGKFSDSFASFNSEYKWTKNKR